MENLTKFIFKLKNTFLFGVLLLVLQSCSSYQLTEKERNSFYVNPISEDRGMYLRNNLLLYFPNQNQEEISYDIKISTNINEDYYLAGSTGYASKGRVRIDVNWQIVERGSKTVRLSLRGSYVENYNVEPSGFAIRNNRDVAIENLSERIASDIRQKIYGFIARENYQEELLQMQSFVDDGLGDDKENKICTDIVCD